MQESNNRVKHESDLGLAVHCLAVQSDNGLQVPDDKTSRERQRYTETHSWVITSTAAMLKRIRTFFLSAQRIPVENVCFEHQPPTK